MPLPYSAVAHVPDEAKKCRGIIEWEVFKAGEPEKPGADTAIISVVGIRDGDDAETVDGEPDARTTGTSGSGRGIGETAVSNRCMALPSLLHRILSPAGKTSGLLGNSSRPAS